MDAEEKADRMVANYAARLRVGQCGHSRVGDVKGQAERYAASVARNKRIRTATGVALGALGVPSIQYPFYYSFALQLGRVDREAWCEHAKRDEGQILVSTWVARGLSREILLGIARNVFNLDLAVEPGPCAPARGL